MIYMGLDWTGLGTWANDFGEEGAKLLGKSGLNIYLYIYIYIYILLKIYQPFSFS